MAVGVGNPRGIANGVAPHRSERVSVGPRGRPRHITDRSPPGLRKRRRDVRTARAGWYLLPAASTSTMTKGRVWSESQTERTPSRTRRCTTAHPRIFSVKRDACIEIARSQVRRRSALGLASQILPFRRAYYRRRTRFCSPASGSGKAARKRAEAGAGVHRVQPPTLPVRLRGRIEDKGCDRQVIGTPGLTCEGRHHRGILEHLLQGVLPCVSKARSL